MPHIGPSEQNKGGVQYLNESGREYGNYMMVNAIRMRALEQVPEKYITTLTLDKPSKELLQKNLTAGNVNFCIIQKDKDHVPVFMLPATDSLTNKLDDEQRKEFMQTVFDMCYEVYKTHCESNSHTPVPKKDCAATVAAGTKTLFGRVGKLFGNENLGNHFTAMIKLPGEDKRPWTLVDPTSLGGPQWFNRKQCGGYASMIEAEAVGFYASKKIVDAQQEAKSNVVWKVFREWLQEMKFKLNTWFAGFRNEAGTEKALGHTETSYGEMADFSACSLAKAFDNKKFNHTASPPPVTK